MIKKYILKPGRHQFVPGSHAVHHNNNLTDEEAEWYLAKYPHIVSKFDTVPKEPVAENDTACRVSDDNQSIQSLPESMEPPIQSVESNLKSVKPQIIIYEDLPPAN
jgi:hypothetical protein